MPGFIIDLDGTLYSGNNPILHADTFIQQLKKNNHPFLLMTNNSTRTAEEICSHVFEVCGFSVEPEQILTSAHAAIRYVQTHISGNRVYLIGQNGLYQAFQQAGYEIVTEQNYDIITGQVDAVVQGYDQQFNYGKLTNAVSLILNGAQFILTNPDHLVPTERGMLPAAGSIGAAIQKASGVEPVVIGKPSSIIMEYAIERLGLPAEEIWMVGDNIGTDIAGGHHAGCKTCLVLTGLATSDNLNELIAKTGTKPDYVANHLLDLYDHLTT